MEVPNMEKRTIKQAHIKQFEIFLRDEEKSENTIQKYLRDLNKFKVYVKNQVLTKQLIIMYKADLELKHELTGANSIIAAINSFLKFMGWLDLCVKQFKIQKRTFCPEETELTKAEYFRLVQAAKKQKNERLYLIIQTICATGIRVSELENITVSAIQKGKATVSCKNKTRTVFIVRELQKNLLNYVRKNKISNGCVFITKSGKPISRCNVWREMKKLCETANVNPQKVFPHNLRHLFARTFYSIEKDIAKLADILGHSNINTTRIYIISTGAEHRAHMENMRLII